MSMSMANVNLYSKLSSKTFNVLILTYTKNYTCTQTLLITSKKCKHAQSNYTNTKLKTCLKHFVPHPAKNQSEFILHLQNHTK